MIPFSSKQIIYVGELTVYVKQQLSFQKMASNSVSLKQQIVSPTKYATFILQRAHSVSN